MMQYKICGKCKVSKDSTNFNKQTSSKDGLQNYCKPCRYVDSKRRYVPLEKVEVIDKLVGKRFGDNEQLEVLGLLSERVNLKKQYVVKCHTCCNDPEMWGQAIFKMMQASISKGRNPCGCSYNPNYSEQQFKILSKRYAEKSKLTFEGFVEGKVDAMAYVKLRCEGGHVWESTNFTRLRTGTGCNTCALVRNTTNSDDLQIYIEQSNLHPKGTTVRISDSVTGEGKPMWDVTCSVCSQDMYSKAGLCSGTFTQHLHSVKGGSLACRCSKVYKWTSEQKEYQIKDIIAVQKLDIDFVSFLGNYYDCDSRVTLHCRKHGNWDTRVSSFTDMGTRCPGCAECGFNGSKPGILYVLKCDNITKVGITNRKTSERISEVNRESGKIFKEEDSYKFYIGHEARRIEKATHAFLETIYSRVSESYSGSTECFLDVDYEKLMSFIEDRIDDRIINGNSRPNIGDRNGTSKNC